MSHFAEIDENNIVTRVLVGDNNEPDEGYSWFIENLGGIWIKTSYNTRGGVHLEGGVPLRKNYAGVGYKYDSQRDAFIPPKPNSNLLNEDGNEINGQWILNEETCLWDFTPEE